MTQYRHDDECPKPRVPEIAHSTYTAGNPLIRISVVLVSKRSWERRNYRDDPYIAKKDYRPTRSTRLRESRPIGTTGINCRLTATGTAMERIPPPRCRLIISSVSQVPSFDRLPNQTQVHGRPHAAPTRVGGIVRLALPTPVLSLAKPAAIGSTLASAVGCPGPRSRRSAETDAPPVKPSLDNCRGGNHCRDCSLGGPRPADRNADHARRDMAESPAVGEPRSTHRAIGTAPRPRAYRRSSATG